MKKYLNKRCSKEFPLIMHKEKIPNGTFTPYVPGEDEEYGI